MININIKVKMFFIIIIVLQIILFRLIEFGFKRGIISDDIYVGVVKISCLIIIIASLYTLLSM